MEESEIERSYSCSFQVIRCQVTTTALLEVGTFFLGFGSTEYFAESSTCSLNQTHTHGENNMCETIRVQIIEYVHNHNHSESYICRVLLLLLLSLYVPIRYLVIIKGG